MFIPIFNNYLQRKIDSKKEIINNKIYNIDKELHKITNPEPRILPWRYRVKAIPIDYEEYIYIEGLKAYAPNLNSPQYKEYGWMNDDKMTFEESDLRVRHVTGDKYKLLEIIEEYQMNKYETKEWAEIGQKDIFIFKLSDREKHKNRLKYGLPEKDNTEQIRSLISEKEELEKQFKTLNEIY